MKNYDITIVGGGMVGASLACALQQLSFRVALIDATPRNTNADHRLIALNYGSCCFLQNLNLWPSLVPHASAIEQIHVSHRGHFGITRIHAKELELPTLGYLIPAQHINTALDKQLNTSDIDIIRPATLKNIRILDTELTELTIQTDTGEETLHSRILIGADGTHSTVRQLLNIPTKIQDYDQSAIVTITELYRSHKHTAYERFLETGAIAMLPLSENTCATIWTTDNKHVAQLMQLTDNEFITQLQNHFGYRLGRFKKTLTRYTYPLKMVVAEQYIKQNTLLLGNAAHTLHPIASQGLNLALYEIAELVDYLSQHKNPASLSLADMKTSSAPQDNSINLTHQLTWLFSTDLFLLNIVRQFGMFSLDACKQAKQFFMKKSMGRAGNMPHLLLEKDYHEHQHTRY